MLSRSAALRRSVGPVATVLVACAAVPAAAQTEPTPPYSLYQIGLTDEYDNVSRFGYRYNYTAPDGTVGFFQNSETVSLNGKGEAIGYSDRYNAAGFDVGKDLWIATFEVDGFPVTRRIGPVGAGYEKLVRNAAGENAGSYRIGAVQFLSENSEAVGYTERWGTGDAVPTHQSDYVSLGRDAWVTSTVLGTEAPVLIGLTDANSPLDPSYEYDFLDANRRAVGTFRYGFAVGQNALGQIAGVSNRYGATGTNFGRDAWVATSAGGTKRIGLSGTGYDWARTEAGEDTGIFRRGNASFINATGRVMGFTERYTADGFSLGSDAWLATPDNNNNYQTRVIGLLEPEEPATARDFEYTYDAEENDAVVGAYRLINSYFLNDAGYLAGTTQRYNPTGNILGQDTWIAMPATGTRDASTRRIGLVGLGYERAYNRPGELGGGTYRSSDPWFQNEAGDVAGSSQRYGPFGDDLGTDAWVARPTDTGPVTFGVGLSGGSYEIGRGTNNGASRGNYRYSFAEALSPDGFVAGYTKRHRFNVADRGQDAWLASPDDAADITLINLTGVHNARYELNRADADDPNAAPDIERYAEVVALNTDLQVIGWSQRYDPEFRTLPNQGGWFYDRATDETTELVFDFRGDVADGVAFTLPQYLAESGVVLGTYTMYSGTGNNIVEEQHAFWWSPVPGPLGNFRDLGALDTSLVQPTAVEWARLADIDFALGNAPGGSPQYIVGTGILGGQSGGMSVYHLSTVPEPTALSLLLLPAAGLLRRRRRSSN